jgi:hypothetical protein
MVINIYSNCCIAGVVEKMKKLDQVTAGCKKETRNLKWRLYSEEYVWQINYPLYAWKLSRKFLYAF